MKSRLALTAWTRLEKFDEFDEKRIVRFIEAIVGSTTTSDSLADGGASGV